MARAQLEYDESGSTFYYFLISFYGIILLPITYFLWPRKDDGKTKSEVGINWDNPYPSMQMAKERGWYASVSHAR